QKDKVNGKILFTHFGLSGPTILNMSSKVRELLKNGEVTLGIDLFPSKNHAEVKKEIDSLISIENNKKIKNILTKLLPKSMIEVMLEEINLEKEKFGHSVTREERMKIVHFVKNIS